MNIMGVHQAIDGIVNLIHLNCGIDQQPHIVYAKSDDLNGILQSKGIPDQYQLVEEAKDVEGEEGRDGVPVVVVFLPIETYLKQSKYISVTPNQLL